MKFIISFGKYVTKKNKLQLTAVAMLVPYGLTWNIGLISLIFRFKSKYLVRQSHRYREYRKQKKYLGLQ